MIPAPSGPLNPFSSMTTFTHFVYLFGLVFWIGSILFFSFFTAPVLFKTLDRSQAGEVIEVLFPRYYGIGYVCAGLILAALLLNWPALSMLKLGIWGVMAAGTFYTGLAINPRVRGLKEQMKSARKAADKKPLEARFQSLHSLAVKLNAAVLLAGLGLLWATAGGLRL